MNKSRFLCAIWTCLLMLSYQSVYASFIYTYDGHNFDTFINPTSYDSSMNISGSIELDSPLEKNFEGHVTPLSFSFTYQYYFRFRLHV